MRRAVTSGLEFRLAGEADDDALRWLLRESPMPGAIRVTFEREPSCLAAAALEGPFHQVAVGREPTADGCDRVAVAAARSVRPRYINGEVVPVGYLSQFRVAPGYARRRFAARALASAFAFCRELHADGRTAFYLMAVVEDNHPASRLLTSDLPGFPRVRPYGRLATYTIGTRRRRRAFPLPGGLVLAQGTLAHLPELLACLERNGRRRQFAPAWTADTLFDDEATPGLAPTDFRLALDGERVVGCLALWDQRAVKQTVVRGYDGLLGPLRRPLNALGAFAGNWPRLPAPGEPLDFAYISHVAVDGDDPRTFAGLLRAACNEATPRGLGSVVIGFDLDDPLGAVIRRDYRAVTYGSRLMLASWEDGHEAVDLLDGRMTGCEVALL